VLRGEAHIERDGPGGTASDSDLGGSTNTVCACQREHERIIEERKAQHKIMSEISLRVSLDITCTETLQPRREYSQSGRRQEHPTTNDGLTTPCQKK